MIFCRCGERMVLFDEIPPKYARFRCPSCSLISVVETEEIKKASENTEEA